MKSKLQGRGEENKYTNNQINTTDVTKTRFGCGLHDSQNKKKNRIRIIELSKGGNIQILKEDNFSYAVLYLLNMDF